MTESLLAYGPWLTNPDIGRITIGFVSSRPCAAFVQYRVKGTTDWTTRHQSLGGQIARGETRHIFHLDHLTPGAAYEYCATVWDTDTDEKQTASSSFTAFSLERKNPSFLIMADFQYSTVERRRLLNAYRELAHSDDCDAILCLGDMVDGINDFTRDALENMANLFCEMGADHIPVLFLRGNHEMRGRDAWRWCDYFGSRDGLPYSWFRQGKAAFLAIDSWTDQPGGGANPVFKYNLDKEFLADEKLFLREAVQSPGFKDAPFRIVLSHGASHSHIDQFRWLNPNMRALTDEFFKGAHPSCPIHAWFCGHIHHYIRTIPLQAACASISCPPQPVTTPEQYAFPLLTTDGPDVAADIVPPSGIHTSVFLLTVHDDMLDIQALSEERNGLIDHITVGLDGHVEEKMSIGHFAWRSELERH